MTDRERERVTMGDWPRLTRFYGISPEEIGRTPNNIIEIYAKALPQLYAEEALLGFMTADMPHMEKGDRKRIHRDYEKMLPEVEPEKVALGTEEGKALAAGLGIGVIVEPTEVES